MTDNKTIKSKVADRPMTGIRFKTETREKLDKFITDTDISLNSAVNLLVEYAFEEMKTQGKQPVVRLVVK